MYVYTVHNTQLFSVNCIRISHSTGSLIRGGFHVFLKDVCMWRINSLVVLFLCLHSMEIKLPVELNSILIVDLDMAGYI